VSLTKYGMVVLGVLGSSMIVDELALRPRLGAGERQAIFLGALIAGINAFAAAALQAWSKGRSTKAVLIAVFGGMTVRMLFVLTALTIAIQLGASSLPLALSLLLYFALFQIVEFAGLRAAAGQAAR